MFFIIKLFKISKAYIKKKILIYSFNYAFVILKLNNKFNKTIFFCIHFY